MKYCVIKSTTRVITKGHDANSLHHQALNTKLDDIFLTANDFEILTEEEYQERLDSEPKPIPIPTSEERIKELEEMVLFLMMNGGM